MHHGEMIHTVSGTVEILFRTHTDAPRGCGKYLHMAFLCVLRASSEAGGESK